LKRASGSWSRLSEEERLECLKRFIEFSRSRVKIPARWLLISHIQWNRWREAFNAPPIPPLVIPSFYRWLKSLCEEAGLRERKDYRLTFRRRHRSRRVKGLLIRREALSKLLSPHQFHQLRPPIGEPPIHQFISPIGGEGSRQVFTNLVNSPIGEAG